MESDITLKTVLEYIQAMRTDLGGRMDRLEGRMDRLDGRMDRLEHRMDRMELRMNRMDAKFSLQLDAIDKRLDTIEISIVDQKHEQRITALEQHTGLVKTA
jgi:predicted nuclease with TOPRIM domain